MTMLLALHYHSTHLTRAMNGTAAIGIFIGLALMAISSSKAKK